MKKEGKKYLSKERLQKTVSHKSSLLKKKKKKNTVESKKQEIKEGKNKVKVS